MAIVDKARRVPAHAPKKPKKRHISLYVDAGLRKELEKIAMAESRNLNGQCELFLRGCASDWQSAKAPKRRAPSRTSSMKVTAHPPG